MPKRLITDSPELQARFDDAGTTAETDSRALVAVTNWPVPRRTGSETFLQDMLDDFNRDFVQ